MYQVVIVDDEVTISEGIANLFPWKEIGFEAHAFSEPDKALQYINQNQVDVLMSDIEMPEMNGLELTKEIAKADIKVVIISSHQNYEYFRAAIQLNVVDYLLKPLKSADIISCFEKIKQELDRKNHVEQEQPKGYYEKILVEVKSYTEEHFQEASLEEAAVRVNLSASYLSRILKEKCDFGFAEYLLQIRMEKAAAMLQDMQYKTYDIAYYVGYDKSEEFFSCFQKLLWSDTYGLQERKYRKMKKKFFLKRFAVYFMAFFIPTFLLFVIAMVIFGNNAEERIISREQKVLESTDTNLSACNQQYSHAE